MSTLSNYRKFVKCVFDSINGPTSSGLSVVAIETVGFIGRSPDGKLALQREGNYLSVLCLYFVVGH